MKKRMFILPAMLLIMSSAYATSNWPRVKPEFYSFHIALPASDPQVIITISDKTGKALYQLQCGTDETPNEDFAYSGDFECMLQTIPPDYTYSTLFTEIRHQDRDWESRARFFTNEVTAPCDEVPDFGKVRSFRLRGMKVTLAMSNVVLSGAGKNQKLKSFDFIVTVAGDPTAMTAIAQPPILDPKWKRLPCRLDESVPVYFRTSPVSVK